MKQQRSTRQVKQELNSRLAALPSVDVSGLQQQAHQQQLTTFYKTLKNHYGIDWFLYLRRYADDRFSFISNEPVALQYLYGEKLYPISWVHCQPSSHYKTGWTTWALSRANLSMHQLWAEKAFVKQVGFRHGIIWINQCGHYCEFFDFSGLTTAIYQLKRAQLQSLIFHFKQYLLANAPILTSNTMSLRYQYWPADIACPPIIQPDQSAAIKTDPLVTTRYYLNGQYCGTYLTHREVDCIRWLINGKTAEETGMILHISKKTVERHFEAIKTKLNCRNKYQIIKIAVEQHII